MAKQFPYEIAPIQEPGWTKNRPLLRSHFKDLEYLPKGKTAWNFTLTACAYAARRVLAQQADLNLWARMHGLPASSSYQQLGSDALVCWHGTSAVRADRIREHGLICREGVWAATRPTIAHGYTRHRSQQFGAGSAMVVLVVSKEQWDAHATPRGPEIVEFHRNVPKECVEYILWSDRAEFVGATPAKQPRPWGVARFKRSNGRWAPQSRPPVPLDAAQTYSTFDEWLDLSVRRILQTLGQAATIEIFSSLYATVFPWEALEHHQVFDALDRLCDKPRNAPGAIKVFSMKA